MNDLIEFPCEFPIKVMGRDHPDFRGHVLALIGKHTNEIEDADVRSQSSSNGSFLSVTVTIIAESREQLDTIYQSLSDDADVLVAL